MIADDPFFQSGDAGATVIRPKPGGRRAAGVSADVPPPDAAWPSPTEPSPERVPGRVPASAPPAPPPAFNPVAVPALVTDNPLVACAGDLLAIAGELRSSLSHPDPVGLRERLVRQVRDFETCARARGLADTVVLPARYVLCALVDESVLCTPWGSQSIWHRQGLLVSFHNEAWGGEKFFEALDRLLAYPAGNLQLLELMYLCLAQGFEGRYRVRDGGLEQLERVRVNLYQTLRAQRGEPERDLSPQWRGVTPQRDPLIRQVPLWVLSAVAALLLLGLFAGFTFALNRDSDPVYLALHGLDRRLPDLTDRPRTPPPAPRPPAEPSLRSQLRDDVSAGRVAVADRPQGQALVILGEALFPSGQATLTPSVLPLIERIGAVLGQLPGPVLVTGHSDSVPIKTLRFPSNWHLSQARAQEVARRLGQITGTPERFRAEGRADSEPAVPENPRDARNRRVEVLLQRPVQTRPTGDAGGAPQ